MNESTVGLPSVTSSARVQVDVGHREPLRRIWRYVGYDEPNYTYTTNGKELLGKLGRMSDGPYFIRCHFLLCSGDGTGRPKWGSTNIYTEDQNGAPVYNWDILDRIIDTLLEMGCRPFIELGFMPEDLTTAPPGTQYDHIRQGGWRFPPRDYGRWMDLISVTAKHCLERYGLREVQGWYWELWNEPDAPGYWQGSVEEYCRLYDFTEAGLHSILPQGRVGGPATTSPGRPEGGEFLKRFLAHCATGRNAVTGEAGTRLDFVSFHSKGGRFRPDPHAQKSTPTIYRMVRHVDAGLEVLQDFPQFGGLEVVVSECDTDGWAAGSKQDNPNLNFRNTEYYASYVGSMVCKLLDLAPDRANRVDGMLTWAFQFEDREYFEGLRTLSTNGIDKPVLNVFRMLAKLGNVRVAVASDRSRDPVATQGGDSADDLPDVSAIATIDESQGVGVLLASHHDDWDIRIDSQVDIDFTGLEPATHYVVERYLVSSNSGNSYSAWVEIGEPQNPTEEEVAVMRSASRLEAAHDAVTTSETGTCGYRVILPAHSVCLLRLLR